MPLSKRARIEVFLPDCRDPAYRNLLDALDTEFTHTFGGATTDYGLDGTYLTHAGRAVRERVNVIYTDVPFDSDQHRNELERYTDELRDAIAKTLEEEEVLIVVFPVMHSTSGRR